MVTGSVVSNNQHTGVTPRGWMLRFCQDNVHRQRGQGGPLLMMSRREDGQRCYAHGDGGLTRRPVIRTLHRNGHESTHRTTPDGLTQLPSRMTHPTMVRRPDQQMVACSARCCNQIVDIRFPISNRDHRRT